MTFRSFAAFSTLIASILTGCTHTPKGDPVISPVAKAGTLPMQVNEVQSAAFWIHPTDPDKSLILVTNERRGLEVHNSAGVMLKNLADGSCPQYVDIVYGFPLNGKPTDLAIATVTQQGAMGVVVWTIDADKRKLEEATADGLIKVLGNERPMGLCTYHSRKTGKFYFFTFSEEEGTVEQYEIFGDANGEVSAKKVRGFTHKTKMKGSIADEEYGYVYFAEEKNGISRLSAEPTAPEDWKLVIRANEHGLIPNVKGPALYAAADGKGYLIAVSQGNREGKPLVNVYERSGDYKYILTIDPSSAGLGPINHSSGVAVTNQRVSPDCPEGALAVNDQQNPNGSEDFKIYSWKDIAKAGKLIVDTKTSRRTAATQSIVRP